MIVPDRHTATLGIAMLGLLFHPMFLRADRADAIPAFSARATQGRPVQRTFPERPSERGRCHDDCCGRSFSPVGTFGAYCLSVRADRPPDVTVTRIVLDGRERPAGAAVDLAGGVHDIVVYVGPRAPRPPAVEPGLSSHTLVEQFRSEMVFWRQLEIALAIVARGDASVLPALEDWLSHEDRHVRGNVAFVFGRLGDLRGFEVLAAILNDRSDRPEGQGRGVCCFTVARQIAADRYFAARLLGRLGDPRAVPLLVPLLRDPEVDYVIPRALADIGDRRAIAPLLEQLDDEDPSIRVLTIYALQDLQAREALPRLRALLEDERRSRFGNLVSVADAARAAIAKLE